MLVHVPFNDVLYFRLQLIKIGKPKYMQGAIYIGCLWDEIGDYSTFQFLGCVWAAPTGPKASLSRDQAVWPFEY